jgi:hypothetical protein
VTGAHTPLSIDAVTQLQRDLAMARLARALDVSAHVLALAQPGGSHISAVPDTQALALSAADYRYRMRTPADLPLTAYVPQWYYDKLSDDDLRRCDQAGITLRTRYP